MRMSDPSQEAGPVKAKAFLVDPATMKVVWMNESAAQDVSCEDMSVEKAIPLAEMTGVPGALREVASSGVPRHLRADVISTVRGSMAVVTSVYRLPDGKVLVLSEQAWHSERRGSGGRGGASRERR